MNETIRHAMELDAFNSVEKRFIEDKSNLKEASQPCEANNDTATSK